jgi:hypothetical protein
VQRPHAQGFAREQVTPGAGEHDARILERRGEPAVATALSARHPDLAQRGEDRHLTLTRTRIEATCCDDDGSPIGRWQSEAAECDRRRRADHRCRNRSRYRFLYVRVSCAKQPFRGIAGRCFGEIDDRPVRRSTVRTGKARLAVRSVCATGARTNISGATTEHRNECAFKRPTKKNARSIERAFI